MLGALEAGVAVSTVSGILNNRSDSWASKTTRERVQAAASRLNFVPNRLARGLRLNRHNVAIVVLPDLTNPFFAGLARNLRVAMESNGYELHAEETEFNFPAHRDIRPTGIGYFARAHHRAAGGGASQYPHSDPPPHQILYCARPPMNPLACVRPPGGRNRSLSSGGCFSR